MLCSQCFLNLVNTLICALPQPTQTRLLVLTSLGSSPGAATINALFPFVSPFSSLTPGLSKEADPKQAPHKYFLNFMKAAAIFSAFQIDRCMYVIYTWNRVRPCGALPVQVLSLSPIPCFSGNGLHSPSLTFPEFQRTGSNSCSSGKGGKAETIEEQTRNQSAA